MLFRSLGFYLQEYWSGLPFPPPGDLPSPGIEPRSPALQAVSLPSEPLGKPFVPFSSNFFFFGWGPFLKSLLNLLHYCFIVSCFVSLALRHVLFLWLLEQGSNAPPYIEK